MLMIPLMLTISSRSSLVFVMVRDRFPGANNQTIRCLRVMMLLKRRTQETGRPAGTGLLILKVEILLPLIPGRGQFYLFANALHKWINKVLVPIPPLIRTTLCNGITVLVVFHITHDCVLEFV